MFSVTKPSFIRTIRVVVHCTVLPEQCFFLPLGLPEINSAGFRRLVLSDQEELGDDPGIQEYQLDEIFRFMIVSGRYSGYKNKISKVNSLVITKNTKSVFSQIRQIWDLLPIYE